MTPEVLRRAAALMRERAEAATEFRDAHTGAPLPWHGNAGAVYDSGAAPIAATADGAKSLHIAAADPPFMLAVAEALDDAATMLDLDMMIPAGLIAVARTYLGSDA